MAATPRKAPDGNPMDLNEFEALLNDAELRVDRLRALYEQWFQGIERLEPVVPRKNLERTMENLRRNQPQQSRLRFRYQNLVQRYTTYIVYWRKTARMIEEGTYRRDVLRARRQRERAREQYRAELEAKKAERASTVYPAEGDEQEASREAALSTTRAGEAAAARPAPASKAAGGLSDERMRRIYDEYVAARRRNNEPSDNVSYEKLSGKVRAMVPQLRSKHAGKEIDFEVVVKNGRVALKPVAR